MTWFPACKQTINHTWIEGGKILLCSHIPYGSSNSTTKKEIPTKWPQSTNFSAKNYRWALMHALWHILNLSFKLQWSLKDKCKRNLICSVKVVNHTWWIEGKKYCYGAIYHVVPPIVQRNRYLQNGQRVLTSVPK